MRNLCGLYVLGVQSIQNFGLGGRCLLRLGLSQSCKVDVLRGFTGDWGDCSGEEGFKSLPGSVVVCVDSVPKLKDDMSLGVLYSGLFYWFTIFVFQASEMVLGFCVFVKG